MKKEMTTKEILDEARKREIKYQKSSFGVNETKADCKRIDFLNVVWVRKE